MRCAAMPVLSDALGKLHCQQLWDTRLTVLSSDVAWGLEVFGELGELEPGGVGASSPPLSALQQADTRERHGFPHPCHPPGAGFRDGEAHPREG